MAKVTVQGLYTLVDEAHNTWRCGGCGFITTFEADGPYENGWDFCPGCGESIEAEG